MEHDNNQYNIGPPAGESFFTKLLREDKFLRRLYFLKKPKVFLNIILALVLLYIIFAPPSKFDAGEIFSINNGDTLQEVSYKLKENNFVRFSSLLNIWVRVTGGQNSIKAGKYVFERPLSVFGIAHRLTNGIYGINSIKITIIEGWTLNDIAEFLEKMEIAKKDDFIEETKKDFSDKLAFTDERPDGATLEGYLFPDTYFILPHANSEDIIEMMLDNLDSKITPEMRFDINARGLSIFKILTMASIIEKEAHNPEDRRLISGVLWNRIKIGMPLQVDAALTYFTDKASLELTNDDLKIDSPYNTYKYYGLPNGPIANPGLDAIMSAIYPDKTSYLYYLSDSDGNTYFTETFEEHKENKFKYLR